MAIKIKIIKQLEKYIDFNYYPGFKFKFLSRQYRTYVEASNNFYYANQTTYNLFIRTKYKKTFKIKRIELLSIEN